MKKIFYLLIFVILFSTIFAHKQHTHQYITIEAYKLLERTLMKRFPAIYNNLGAFEQNIGTAPWLEGKIVTGAWREDNEDVVYLYSMANTPSGMLTNLLSQWVELFNDNNEWFSSVTHFWDPDQGDLADSEIQSIGTITVPNAYQKMLKFKNGTCSLPVETLAYGLPNSQGYLTGTNRVILMLKYNSLQDLLNNSNIYITKVVWIATGQETIYSSPRKLLQENLATDNLEDLCKRITYEVLGRMCHLLQDMSVPAHVHRDAHGDSKDYIRQDTYESFFGYEFGWDAFSVYNTFGGFINANNATDPIHYLMYTTAQMADHYGSNGPYEGDGNDILGGDYNADEIVYLNNVNLGSLGTPTGLTNPLNVDQVKNIRDTMIPQAIRATAGLLYWFITNANLEFVQLYEPVAPMIRNVGTVKGNSDIIGSLTISNPGIDYYHGNIKTTNSLYDLDYINTPTSYEDKIYFGLYPGESITINYKGIAPAYYGPFTEVFEISDNFHQSETFTIIGNIALPDFCFAETTAMAASPEEQIFDEAFVDYSSVYSDSIAENDKTIKEKLKFAYKLLNEPTTEKVENICKKIIQKYPKSEMGISFYALGLLWDAALSDEAPEFNEEDFITYLYKLTKSKDKYKINGYAQLLLSLFEIDKTTNGLEALMEEYGYDELSELSLFYKFIHYYVYKKNNDTARNILSELDEMFEDSKYGYQAHLMLNDEGYSLEGLKLLMKKKESNYLFAKSNSNGNGIFEEIPTEYELFNNYPNPFNPSTTIKYSVPKNSNIKVRIYNMMGQLIKTLVNESKSPGNYEVQWYGKNEENLSVASGIYFYQLESENFVKTNKMILLK
jgi:hypothetical protein